MDERARSVQTKTVLFTDGADSTARRTTLGDTEADAVESAGQRAQEAAIAAHGGTLVKSLGDGVMATFDGAAAAIAAAVDIPSGARERARRGGVASPLRIGISTGDVSSTADGDHLGTPVIEAARLCAAAEAEQILIADVVRVLAGSRSVDDLVELGPLDLKGLAAPVSAWEVRWADTPPGPALLPSGLRYDDGFPFVGRDRERAQLDAAWQRAQAGEVALVLIAGEPGAGKTRLTAELARDAVADGALLLFGSCEDGLGVPHQPFVECIRELLARPGRPRLGSQPGELVRLVPDIVERYPDLPPPLRSDPETERYQLFNAVVDLLGDASSEAPVVLVLDDLHWATAPTLQLLRHVVRARLAAPVLIVGTYRSTEVDGNHPLSAALADLHRTPGVDHVDLSGLEARAVRRYLEGIAGYDLDARADALAARVHAETDGNPFFMREVLLNLVDSGQLYLVDGRWDIQEGYLDAVPARARDVIAQRLTRLGDDAHALLTRAAVIGRDFSLGMLAELAGADEEALLDPLERAIAARLVQEVGVDEYRFTHALVRSSLLDALSVSRRARLHRQVAESLEARGGATSELVEELADHWLAAGQAGDPLKAIAFTRLAAQRAAEQVAHDEAAVLLATALDLARRSGVGGRDEAELLSELGAAQRRAGDPAAHQTLLGAYERALALGATDLLVTAVLEDARTAAVLEADAERVERLERALAAMVDGDWPERERLLANLGFELSFTDDRARSTAVLDEALALARQRGDPSNLAYVLSMRVNAFRWADTAPERLEACTEIESISARLDDPAMHFLAAFRRAQVLMFVGDTAGFRGSVATMGALSDRLGQPIMAWNLARRRAELALIEGDLDLAERAAGEMRKLGLDLQLGNAEPIYVSFVVKVLNLAGQPDRSVALWEEWADRIHLIGFPFGLAQALLLCGRRDDAAARWERSAPRDLRELAHDPWWLETMGIAAEVACDLGDVERSVAIAELLDGHPSHLVTSGVGALCSSDHVLGVAHLGSGDHDAAAAALRRSIDFCASSEAPLLVAGSQVRLAEVLHRRGADADVVEARALLDAASETADRFEARGLADAVQRTAGGVR